MLRSNVRMNGHPFKAAELSAVAVLAQGHQSRSTHQAFRLSAFSRPWLWLLPKQQRGPAGGGESPVTFWETPVMICDDIPGRKHSRDFLSKPFSRQHPVVGFVPVNGKRKTRGKAQDLCPSPAALCRVQA